jgi:hypothetical protein
MNMSNKIDELFKLCEDFCDTANGLDKEAAEKKLDPKAKVRNRGKVVFPAGSAKVKDNKDHFELNNEGQARAALSYAGHYGSAPPWYSGSLEELKGAIRRKVKSEFPSINVSEPKKKKAMEELLETLTIKYAQMPMQGDPASSGPVNHQDLGSKMNAVLAPFGYAVLPGTEPRVLTDEKVVDVPVKALPTAKWQGTGHQAGEIAKVLSPLVPGMKINPTVSF